MNMKTTINMLLYPYKGWLINEDGECFSMRLKRKLKPRITGKPKQQYYTLAYKVNGKVKNIKVHIIVATLFIKNPENKKYVNHKNGNKLDNRVINLEWCTAEENCDHAYRIGLKDSKHYTGVSSMKKINVSVLRSEYIDGITQAMLAEKYKVDQSTISRLINI